MGYKWATKIPVVARSNESGSLFVALNEVRSFVNELDVIHSREVGIQT